VLYHTSYWQFNYMYFILCLFNYCIINTHLRRRIVGWIINSKEFAGKRLWPNLRYYPGTFLEGLTKITKYLIQYISEVPTKIRTEHLLHTSLERYRYSKPALKQSNMWTLWGKNYLQNTHLNQSVLFSATRGVTRLSYVPVVQFYIVARFLIKWFVIS
jgi:hypothetical protein